MALKPLIAGMSQSGGGSGGSTLSRVSGTLRGYTLAPVTASAATGTCGADSVGPWRLVINGNSYLQAAADNDPLNLPAGWTDSGSGVFVKNTNGSGNSASVSLRDTPSLVSWTDGDESNPAVAVFSFSNYAEGTLWSITGGGGAIDAGGPHSTANPSISGWTWSGGDTLTYNSNGSLGSSPSIVQSGTVPTFSFTDGATADPGDGVGEVTLIAASGTKLIKCTAAYVGGDLAEGMKLSLKSGGVYTDITAVTTPSPGLALMALDATDGAYFLTGKDPGESLVARLNGSVPNNANTAVFQVIAEQI